MRDAAPRSELKNAGYEIFIAIISLLSILNLVLVYVADDADIQDVLRVMNWILSGILLIDFSYRFATAPARSRLLLPWFRLGRPVVEPAVRGAQVPADLPPPAGLPSDARPRRPRGRAGRLIRERAGSALLSACC